MSSNPVSDTWSGIEAGWRSGRLAHAWLLQGAPHGAALHFAEKMLDLIFDSDPHIRSRTHPDIIWIEPQSKSRRISIDDIRDNLIRPLSQTSFAGGWKAAVLFDADRMTVEASNAFLKTLEEPSPNTLLLLLTAEPQALLPTITSRCQRIVLGNDAGEESPWHADLLDLLRALPPSGPIEAGICTARLAGLLENLETQYAAEEEEALPDDLIGKERKELLAARTGARLTEARAGILRTLLLWQRDVLMLTLGQDGTILHFKEETDALGRQARRCNRAAALRRTAAVEEMARQFERNLPAKPVLGEFFAQMV